jgi:hypothetical protein
MAGDAGKLTLKPSSTGVMVPESIDLMKYLLESSLGGGNIQTGKMPPIVS